MEYVMTFSIGLKVAIITYIFSGLSYYKASELEVIKNRWLSWVPLLNNYILFKLGKKNPKYILLPIISLILSFIIDFTYSNIVLISIGILILILSIWTIIVKLEAYLNISNKYDINPAWFIVGIFIPPFYLVVYIIFYTKIRKLKRIEPEDF